MSTNMKYILIVLDGIADEPIEELDGKTPLMAAHTPNMDMLARSGIVGAVMNTPPGMDPGSDITNMSILGYDPRIYYRGRAAIEAVGLGIPLETTQIAFRTNLVTTDGERILDSAGGHVSTDEAKRLIKCINHQFGSDKIKFYTGVSYRHIMLWDGGSDAVHCTAPYKIHDLPFDKYLPNGEGSEMLNQMIRESYELLDNHPVNTHRRNKGKLPANMIWFWAQGREPEMPSFKSRHGVSGSVIAAVDLIRGLGRLTGLRVVNVPGATGYIDTNYKGKGEYALRELKRDDFVWVHVEAADEASHEGNLAAKIEAIEKSDDLVLGTILKGLQADKQPFKILLLPDHPTSIAAKTHSNAPSPFVIYSSEEVHDGARAFDETIVAASEVRIKDGYTLIERLFA